MNYPLISEYVDAIRSAEDNFDKLCDLRPVLDDNGNPIMSSGNFAVVFKMEDVNTGKLYAVKCFTKEQEGREEAYRQIADELEFVQSTYLAKVTYYDRELFVYTQTSDDSEFPVLLMDWVEGETLDKYIRQNINDMYALEMLAYNFSRLAMWLLPQPFAHGDLKPDNILVHNDGSLTLVDYDGMYVPAMQGQKSRELGSPDFRHPLRTEDDFNEHIDDFPAISILLSLRLIASAPSLLDKYGASDQLLFSERDYRNLSSCKLLKSVFPSQNTDINTLVSLFTIACIHKTLANVSIRILAIAKSKKPEIIEVEEELSTEVTNEDLANAVVDEFGAKYSKDGKRLLRVPDIERYKIKEGTKIICNGAFYWCFRLRETTIPEGVINIGNGAFYWCNALQKITIPESVTSIGEEAFYNCKFLQKIIIPKSVTSIGDRAFSECISLQKITISEKVTRIGKWTFSQCESLQKITIPENVSNIDDGAFFQCESLQGITIPENVSIIGSKAFSGCWSLNEIVIPANVTTIGYKTFEGCSSLQRIIIPENVTTIDDNAFDGCESLQDIIIPPSVTSIGYNAFSACKSLLKINIPSGVTIIGDKVFEYCSSLQEIKIPKGYKEKFKQLIPDYKDKLIEVDNI